MRKLYILTIAMLLVLISSAACSSNIKEPSKAGLSAFDQFKSSYVKVNYPTNMELEGCLQKDDCKSLYVHTMNSLDTLIDKNRKQTLSDILWIINNKCPQGLKGEFDCRSAVALLYFFDTKAEEENLFKFVTTANPKILDTLFVENIIWLMNRPQKQKWLLFIDSSNSFDKTTKEHLRAEIEDPITGKRIQNIREQYENWKHSMADIN